MDRNAAFLLCVSTHVCLLSFYEQTILSNTYKNNFFFLCALFCENVICLNRKTSLNKTYIDKDVLLYVFEDAVSNNELE